MLACGDVPVHDVLYHVPQAGPHHGGRPVARAVNLHEYAALRVAAAENIFQVAANIFAITYYLSYFMWSRHTHWPSLHWKLTSAAWQSEVWLQASTSPTPTTSGKEVLFSFSPKQTPPTGSNSGKKIEIDFVWVQTIITSFNGPFSTFSSISSDTVPDPTSKLSTAMSA